MRNRYLLLLPLAGCGVWIATYWITSRVLQQTHRSSYQLRTNYYPQVWVAKSLTISTIRARVDHNNATTEVVLEANHPTLHQLEFKFPLTEPNQLEVALAKELNTSSETIRSLIRYRFD